MAVIEFDVTAFRDMFPAFASASAYPTARLQINWTMATSYISDVDYGWIQGARRTLALNLMTAHLTALGAQLASGQTPGMMQSSTIDKISITMTPPPVPDQFQFWLGLTGYGQQLLALLQANSAGGIYVGGRCEIGAFRKAFGRF